MLRWLRFLMGYLLRWRLGSVELPVLLSRVLYRLGILCLLSRSVLWSSGGL